MAELTTETAVTETAKKTETKSKKKVAAPESDGFCVYIGPTILGVIQKGTVFRGSVESVLAEIAPAVGKFPKIANLVIDGSELVEARTKVKTPGNLLYKSYHDIVSGKKKEE